MYMIITYISAATALNISNYIYNENECIEGMVSIMPNDKKDKQASINKHFVEKNKSAK